ncbi:hypothetical protein BD779DRAFT_1072929 [Infundibulicybe gibba]|nr:hypothetical protein BD779DRAFT_1072929 [Infundibulicybe gibba]
MVSLQASSGGVVVDLGPIFVGIVLNWCLLGCLAVQVYTYYLSQKDHVGLKFLVGFISIIEVAHSSVATEYAWKLLVIYNGDVPTANSPSIKKVSSYLPVMSGITSAAVQIFFAWRIRSLNRTITGQISAVFICLVALMQSLGCVIMTNVPAPIDRHPGPPLITLLWLAPSVVADILIAVTMLYTLHKARHQSLSKGTETILSRLMVNTIETGVVTAVAASLGLVLYVLDKYYETTSFVLGKLFANVCLMNLNARFRTQRLGGNLHTSTTHIGGSGPDHTTTTLRFATQSTNMEQSRTSPEDSAEMGIAYVREEVIPVSRPPSKGEL